MADLENVITSLQGEIYTAAYYGYSFKDLVPVKLLQDALELLKAQEPVKPFVTGNGHTFEEAETWWYACGNCNKPIDPNDQYCRHCGKAMKWDG